MRHVQMEPVWGGSVDTAAELRAICAMGLANTRYPGKLRAMVDLLVDREWQARAGAVRALAVAGSEAALLLLRFKALSGDPEPEVIADCFTGLLSAEGADAVPFVASFADSKDKEVKDAAILALGASRRADAIEWMIAAFPCRRRYGNAQMYSALARHFAHRNRSRVCDRLDSGRQRADLGFRRIGDGNQPRRRTDSSAH